MEARLSPVLGPDSKVLREGGTKGMGEGHGRRLLSKAGSKVSGSMMFLDCCAVDLIGKAPSAGVTV